MMAHLFVFLALTCLTQAVDDLVPATKYSQSVAGGLQDPSIFTYGYQWVKDLTVPYVTVEVNSTGFLGPLDGPIVRLYAACNRAGTQQDVLLQQCFINELTPDCVLWATVCDYVPGVSLVVEVSSTRSFNITLNVVDVVPVKLASGSAVSVNLTGSRTYGTGYQVYYYDVADANDLNVVQYSREDDSSLSVYLSVDDTSKLCGPDNNLYWTAVSQLNPISTFIEQGDDCKAASADKRRYITIRNPAVGTLLATIDLTPSVQTVSLSGRDQTVDASAPNANQPYGFFKINLARDTWATYSLVNTGPGNCIVTVQKGDDNDLPPPNFRSLTTENFIDDICSLQSVAGEATLFMQQDDNFEYNFGPCNEGTWYFTAVCEEPTAALRWTLEEIYPNSQLGSFSNSIQLDYSQTSGYQTSSLTSVQLQDTLPSSTGNDAAWTINTIIVESDPDNDGEDYDLTFNRRSAITPDTLDDIKDAQQCLSQDLDDSSNRCEIQNSLCYETWTSCSAALNTSGPLFVGVERRGGFTNNFTIRVEKAGLVQLTDGTSPTVSIAGGHSYYFDFPRPTEILSRGSISLTGAPITPDILNFKTCKSLASSEVRAETGGYFYETNRNGGDEVFLFCVDVPGDQAVHVVGQGSPSQLSNVSVSQENFELGSALRSEWTNRNTAFVLNWSPDDVFRTVEFKQKRNEVFTIDITSPSSDVTLNVVLFYDCTEKTRKVINFQGSSQIGFISESTGGWVRIVFSFRSANSLLGFPITLTYRGGLDNVNEYNPSAYCGNFVTESFGSNEVYTYQAFEADTSFPETSEEIATANTDAQEDVEWISGFYVNDTSAECDAAIKEFVCRSYFYEADRGSGEVKPDCNNKDSCRGIRKECVFNPCVEAYCELIDEYNALLCGMSATTVSMIALLLALFITTL